MPGGFLASFSLQMTDIGLVGVVATKETAYSVIFTGQRISVSQKNHHNAAQWMQVWTAARCQCYWGKMEG
jgi:hypothetical protein